MRKLSSLAVVTVFIASALLLPFAAPIEASATTWPGYNGKIAFSSNRDGFTEIYVMNADGSNQAKLTNDDWFKGSPQWSPDGSKIAFYSTLGGGSHKDYP